jgi:hypothetical protein
MAPRIEKAARWLIELREHQPKIIPALCRQFALSKIEAISAIREASRLRMIARSEGGE